MEKLPCATPHPMGLPSSVWQSGVSQMVKVTGWLSCDCQQETQTLPITPNEQTEPFQRQVCSLPVGLSANRLVSLDSHMVDPKEGIRLSWKLNPCIYQQFPDLLVLTLSDSLLQIQLVLCLTNPTIALMMSLVHNTLPYSHRRCYVSCHGVSSKALAR